MYIKFRQVIRFRYLTTKSLSCTRGCESPDPPAGPTTRTRFVSVLPKAGAPIIRDNVWRHARVGWKCYSLYPHLLRTGDGENGGHSPGNESRDVHFLANLQLWLQQLTKNKLENKSDCDFFFYGKSNNPPLPHPLNDLQKRHWPQMKCVKWGRGIITIFVPFTFAE